MSASSFVPPLQYNQYRSAQSNSQHTHPSSTASMTMSAGYERDGYRNATGAGGYANGFNPAPGSILIRRLPLKADKDTLRSMVVWSKEFIDGDVLPRERSQDQGYSSAILHFKTQAGAQEAKSLLDGKPHNNPMIVEILTPSRSYSYSQAPARAPSTTRTGSSSASTNSSAGPTPRRFDVTFQSMDGTVSPTATNKSAYVGTELPNPESTSRYQSLFSPQSPIGNHLNDRMRITGKSLINNDSPEDDETGELLKDPVAYAENGHNLNQQRRSTLPQLPVSRLANLSLNTNMGLPAPAPMSSYLPGQTMSAMTPGRMTAMSPTGMVNHNGPPMNYQLGSQHYHRHNFPPVNPADQNPPCNTLYVGNLPIDTSEDELKAMFSKQRGYKRLCFRTKQNGPMCFVEFEDVSFATKALHELYGHPLHNSVKGGIRLSFSKNPLGVRSGQGNSGPPGPMGGPGGPPGFNGMLNGGMSGPSFSTANGPPPGLAAPPGLRPNRNAYGGGMPMNNGYPYQNSYAPNHQGWNPTGYANGAGHQSQQGQQGSLMGGPSNGFPPPYMMGR